MSSLLQVQREFAARIRHPEAHPDPADVAPERMQLYERLFHNNVQRLLAKAFPRTRKFLGNASWRQLVRDFYASHASATPYFWQLGQEFLTFLEADKQVGLPDFVLELAHYEWVPRALRNAEDPPPMANVDRQGDLLSGQVAVSPLAWPLAYRHPVHAKDADLGPQGPPPCPTFLIARRLRDGRVRVLASNPLTHRLLALLADAPSGRQAIDALAAELPQLDRDRLHREGAAILQRLRDAEVLLGVRVASAASQNARLDRL